MSWRTVSIGHPTPESRDKKTRAYSGAVLFSGSHIGEDQLVKVNQHQLDIAVGT